MIGRMVNEAAQMILVSSERLIVPFYACVTSAAAVRRRTTGYAPTHVLAVNTLVLRQTERVLRQQHQDNTGEQGLVRTPGQTGVVHK